MDITLLPAHEQARLIAQRDVSARELLALVVDRYERLNPTVNAVVVERIDDAKSAAAAADQAVVDGAELSPFHGVPVTVKEVIDWAGTPSTWGDPAHAAYLPARNAEVLARLLTAGAVLWGKTNVPLDLGEWQTFNSIYGRTNNPHDLERTPGGSSGGAAVSLALGFAALEVGSDIGGSIRVPSHYCGVFGHKPSFGTVSTAGHSYPGQGAEVDINVVGPMARSAHDLEAAMRLFSDRILVEEHRHQLADFTVGVMLENPCGGEQDNAMTSVLGAAVDALIEADVSVVAAPTTIDHERAQQNYLLMNYAATALFDRPRRTNDPAAHGAWLTHAVWIQLANERERIRNQWSSYFDQVDLLLCPVMASAAPPHQTDVPFPEQTIPVNGQWVSNQDQWFWAGIASGSYLPATVAPVGRTASGLPVGLQIIAPFVHDLRSIRFASLIENMFGGFEPPTMAVSTQPKR